VSSRPQTYRIIVGGNEELGFGFCAKLLDRSLPDPKTAAKESLEDPWPEDEWTKLVTISVDEKITTLEIDMELHGPWVWELYSTLEPRDYFRRFDGVIYCADPSRSHLPAEISNFMESVSIHTGKQLPAMIIVDRSRRWEKGQVDALREMAESLDLPIEFIRLNTGENIESSFKALAKRVHARSSE
jgi:hypothetical protein